MNMTFSIGDVVAIVGLLGSIFHFAAKLGGLRAQVEEDKKNLERLMGIVFGQMKFVALETGTGSFHSPFRLAEEHKLPFIQFSEELHTMYRSEKVDDAHFMLQIQESLGGRLEKIWSESKFDPGHCLLACLEIAKEAEQK